MTASDIAHELGGRRTGKGWVAKCPAHEDRTPSLSLTDRDGMVLVKCFGGCSQADVIAALRSRGLWPEPERSEWTAEQRQAWCAARERDERDSRAANWFRLAAVALGEELLAVMPVNDRDRGPVTRLLLDIQSGDSRVLQTYREWRDASPELTAAMVKAGRASDERVQVMLARWLTKEVEGHAA